MTEQDSKPVTGRDFGFAAIVALVACNSLWLLLMPWVPAIAKCSLDRFHLRTGSFVAWAIQNQIPSMYNFANQYEVRELPPGFIDPLIDETERRYINHFPARIVTFADGRYKHLRQGQHRWITISSMYRGQRVETRFHAEPKQGGGYDLVRIPPREDRGE